MFTTDEVLAQIIEARQDAIVRDDIKDFRTLLDHAMRKIWNAFYRMDDAGKATSESELERWEIAVLEAARDWKFSRR